VVVGARAQVITQVFPNPPAVMRELAQRIFEQRVRTLTPCPRLAVSVRAGVHHQLADLSLRFQISMYLERMLQHSGTADSVYIYLKLLATAFGKTNQLVLATRARSRVPHSHLDTNASVLLQVAVLQEYKTDLDFAAMVDSLLLNYTDKCVPLTH
jgi:hypothetical protein